MASTKQEASGDNCRDLFSVEKTPTVIRGEKIKILFSTIHVQIYTHIYDKYNVKGC